MFVQKGELFGHWDCEWQYPWDELLEPPRYTSKGIQVLLKVGVQTPECVQCLCLWVQYPIYGYGNFEENAFDLLRFVCLTIYLKKVVLQYICTYLTSRIYVQRATDLVSTFVQIKTYK